MILLETRIFHQRFGQRVGIRCCARQWRNLLILVLIHAYYQGPAAVTARQRRHGRRRGLYA